MGKFRSKLKRSSGGKRWRKGQSCVSNPEIRKHRDAVRSGVFQTYGAPNHDSKLTVDALQKHDAIQSYVNSTVPLSEASEDVESSVSLSTTYKTLQSFASEWSSCSNMSYARFLNIFRPDSALHKEMLAILAAITEVIKQNDGKETNTEYFCALLTTLEQVYNVENRNEDQVTAVLSLLNMGIKTVPEGVLKKCFSDTIQKMLHILKDYADTENNAVIKSVLGIIAVLLKNQDLAAWSNSSVVQTFNAILNPFCIHSKPKWRKTAQQAAAYVVTSLHQDGVVNIPADKVAEFCIGVLEHSITGNSGTASLSNVQAGQTTILHTLGLMKDTISYYPKPQIKKSCETVLRLISLNSPLVTSCGLQVLHALFSAQFAVISGKLNAQIIAALYEYQPSTNDIQPTQAWLLVMQQAHIHLADVDTDISCSSLPKFFSTVTQLWLSDKTEVLTAATHTLEVVLKDAIAPVCTTKDNVDKYRSKLAKCFSTIEQGLGYQYHNVWHQVLYVISVMFEAGGANCSDMFLSVLKSLAELRDSYKFSYNNELERAVGAAIRAMGPEVVLSVISLKKDNGDLNLDRSWLLPVLKENIKFSTLSYFINGILPLATYCQKRAAQLAEANDGIGAHSSELLYMQLWNLLPCFCNHATDIKENFKSIARILGTAISDMKELRLAVMASLRKLITSAKESENPEDLKEISRFDKNYLPILFNVYTTKPIGTDEEGHRLAALDTIKMFLSIAQPEIVLQLFTSALERLNAQSEDPEDSFIKESILDLIRVLIPYQSKENINTLYQQCIKCLPEIKNSKEQKKAYRLLEEICSAKSEACKEFIKENRKDVQSLLKKSLDSAVVSSKGARLRCLNYLIKAQPQLDHTSRLIRAVIPEAVISCKDINERTRSIAYEVLNTVAETLMKHNEIQEFLTMVVAGLAGTVQLMSCTILALASLIHHFSGILGTDNIKLILDNVTTLCTSSTREVVASCLSLLKVYITSFPSPMVAASLPTIMKALTSMTEDCKRHFRLKVRDILDRLVRKYGFESLTPLVPNSDTVMYKRLRNLKKLNARKKRKKEELSNAEEHDDFDEQFIVKSKPKSVEEILADSDSDFEDMETDQPKAPKTKKQVSTWIEEDPDSIVDFTDPTATSKITATRPGQTPTLIEKKKTAKDRGFKTASDGRLVITDDADSESDSDKKLKINFDSDSDSGDDQSLAETLNLKNSKRKRSDSSVKSGFSLGSSKYRTGGTGIHRPVGASTSSVYSGKEYRAKKAKGDVKKKGKPDPYAYLPLQRSTLNKRKKKKAAGQFKNIVKAAKSGALKGAKAKKKKKI